MNKAHLIKWDSIYTYETADTIELNVLSDFLTDDVGPLSSSWKQWLNEPQAGKAMSNMTSVDKNLDGTVLLEGVYIGDPAPTMKMKIEQLLHVLDQWEKLYKEKPEEILIIQEDAGNIYLKGLFDSPCHRRINE